MEALNKAKMMLKEGYTCVLCSESKTYTATGRGISPVRTFPLSAPRIKSWEKPPPFCMYF